MIKSNTLEIVFARQRKYLPNKVSNINLCYVTMFCARTCKNKKRTRLFVVFNGRTLAYSKKHSNNLKD